VACTVILYCTCRVFQWNIDEDGIGHCIMCGKQPSCAFIGKQREMVTRTSERQDSYEEEEGTKVAEVKMKGNAKLSDQDIKDITRELNNGKTVPEIATAHNVARTTIYSYQKDGVLPKGVRAKSGPVKKTDEGLSPKDSIEKLKGEETPTPPTEYKCVKCNNPTTSPARLCLICQAVFAEEFLAATTGEVPWTLKLTKAEEEAFQVLDDQRKAVKNVLAMMVEIQSKIENNSMKHWGDITERLRAKYPLVDNYGWTYLGKGVISRQAKP